MNSMLMINLLQVILISNVNSADQRIDPLVSIDQGLVRGLLGKDGFYGYFLGIPYAEVDLDNPFGDAKPPPSFEPDIFEAITHVMCPQRMESNQSEDASITINCLTLNIYIPDEASTGNPLPVLVWVHGGNFMHGSGASYNPELLMDKSIIVITINYRLGPYGFFCLDSHKVPGNQGLKDQHLAFQWVKNNIAAFGGNPNEITIGGQDTGATSVLLHLYADKDKFFKRIIAQSGTPTNPGHFYLADLDAAIKLAQYLGYNITDTESALKDLAKAGQADVIEAFYKLGLKTGPCKERSFSGVKNFVYSYPFFLSNEENVRDTPILIGHSAEEVRANQLNDEYFDRNPFYERLKENFKDLFVLTEAAENVRLFYIGDKYVSTNESSVMANFESDFSVNYPVQNMITQLVNENAGPIYSYVFSYVDNTDAETSKYSNELKFLFKSSSTVNSDKLMIERMTNLWANFVKYGNPTPTATDLLPVSWHPVTPYQRPYLDLKEELQLLYRIYHDRMTFWDLFYKLYGKYHQFARNCVYDCEYCHLNKD